MGAVIGPRWLDELNELGPVLLRESRIRATTATLLRIRSLLGVALQAAQTIFSQSRAP